MAEHGAENATKKKKTLAQKNSPFLCGRQNQFLAWKLIRETTVSSCSKLTAKKVDTRYTVMIRYTGIEVLMAWISIHMYKQVLGLLIDERFCDFDQKNVCRF